MTSYTIPTANSDSVDVVAGPDGALWFTEFGANKIGRITTTGQFSEYALANLSNPGGITAGPDGALWFAEFGSSQ